MPEWIENLLRGRVGTANVIAVLLSIGYLYMTCFTVTYTMVHAKSLDKEVMANVGHVLSAMREIVMVIIAYMIGNAKNKTTSTR